MHFRGLNAIIKYGLNCSPFLNQCYTFHIAFYEITIFKIWYFNYLTNTPKTLDVPVLLFDSPHVFTALSNRTWEEGPNAALLYPTTPILCNWCLYDHQYYYYFII